MPRTVRIDIPSLLQHVIVRGIERRDIFLDDGDRRLFFERLSNLLAETGAECLAWALMSTLLLTTWATISYLFPRPAFAGKGILFEVTEPTLTMVP